MDDRELKKRSRQRYVMFFILCSLIFVYYCLHVAMMYAPVPDDRTAIPVLSAITKGLDHLIKAPFELTVTAGFNTALFYGILIPFLGGLMIFSNQKNTLFHKEHGTGRFGTRKEKKRFEDPDDSKNMILTNDVKISMNTRLTRLNNNQLVVGGSGSGKTRFFAKPNIAQANCSYVITDPKGELLASTGTLMEEEGYRVLCFNLREKEYSCCYNPFAYIHTENDVFKLINQLIKNTNPSEQKSSGADPFWEKSEIVLLEAIFFYLWLECPPEEQNFKHVMQMLDLAQASEEDENQKSPLDLIFENLAEEKGDDYIACKQYGIFKKAGGKTAKSILISVGARLSVFNLQDVSDLTMTDTLQLDRIGDRKTVLYIVIPDSDGSFNFLVSMLYSQLFDELYFQADFGEIKWDNDKVLFRSGESLDIKRNLLKNTFEEYEETRGDLRKNELRKSILGQFGEIEKEFGLPYPSLDHIIAKDIMDQYLSHLDTCFIRLSHKAAALQSYCYEVTELYKSLRLLFTGSDKKAIKTAEQKKTELKKIMHKMNSYGMRIEREYGIGNIHSQGFPQYVTKGFLNSYFGEVKKYILDIRMMIKELTLSNDFYGTRKSFDDKCRRIEELEGLIQKNERLIGETSPRQKELRKEYHTSIADCRKKIGSINLAAEYEFGVKNLERRKRNGGRLPVHVRCILDEFANISPIPDFSKLVATMRSREISVSIILQSIGQIKEMYKDNYESIIGNCDSFLFLGGQEQSTLELVSKKLGKATIDKRTHGTSKGSQGSSSVNWDNMGRELMFDYEIGQMDNKDCLLFIRGNVPFKSRKYDLETHKNYPRLGDTDNLADPRLFPFMQRFHTKEMASGAEQEKAFMDDKVQAAARNILAHYAGCHDVRGVFEPVRPDQLQMFDLKNRVASDILFFDKTDDFFKEPGGL